MFRWFGNDCFRDLCYSRLPPRGTERVALLCRDGAPQPLAWESMQGPYTSGLQGVRALNGQVSALHTSFNLGPKCIRVYG